MICRFSARIVKKTTTALNRHAFGSFLRSNTQEQEQSCGLELLPMFPNSPTTSTLHRPNPWTSLSFFLSLADLDSGRHAHLTTLPNKPIVTARSFSLED
jgi:hypothetical protein